jgi:hypothetical protein
MEEEKKADDFDPAQLVNDLERNLKLTNKKTSLFKSEKNCFIAKDAIERM